MCAGKQSLEFNAQPAHLSKIVWGQPSSSSSSPHLSVLTMLAAVRERQKEIGASCLASDPPRCESDVQESLLLSAVAAGVGLVLGVLGAAYGPKIVPGLDLHLSVTAPILVAGAALAIVLAAIATVYPAFLATRLDPAIALRKL
jgi:uncharacterized membrane protein YfcA